MRAAGIHTYLGGMELGVRRVFDDVVGSCETWPDAIVAREIVNRPTVMAQRADLVFANPPCSRFSNTACEKFDDTQKANLSAFCELEEVIAFAEKVQADTIWWETGPLAWGREGMAVSVNEYLGPEWTSFMVRYDTRYSGIPQRRPRTHIIHTRLADSPGGNPPPQNWPTVRIGEYLQARVPDGWEISQDHRWPNSGKTPGDLAKFLGVIATLKMNAPSPIHPGDFYCGSVLTGRYFAWWEWNRWWYMEEYAAIQDHPPEEIVALAKVKNPGWALKMLSKGVSPSAAEFVGREVVQRMHEPTGDEWEFENGVWKLDCGVRDKETGRRHESLRRT